MNSYIAVARANPFIKYRRILTSVNNKLRRTPINCFRSLSQSAPTAKNNDLKDEPMNFFGSKAATWQAKQNRDGGHDEMLWYQPYVISASLAVFLLYFCVLREENDIDAKLEGNLYDHVSGLEEAQLCISYKYNKENGLDVTELEKRLTELGIDVHNL